ncbi:MAG: MlaD family protein [Pseudomonadota bacterium]
MSDATHSKMDVTEKGKGWLNGLSLIWAVPVVALLASIGLIVQSYLERDIQITIQFPEAGGIEAGKTNLRYRDVVVGTVASVEFPDSLEHVNVVVDVRRDMAQFLDQSAEFWLVTAEISAQGVSGLDTLFSGVFIQGEWDADVGEPRRLYIAKAKAPIIAPGANGIEITLTSTESGSISVGAPVLHKGIQVGSIEDVTLSEEGGLIVITAFVEAPYDKLINTGTRFWNASGIDVNFGEDGLNVQVDSLSSLLAGGVSFDTSISGGEPVSGTARFDLFANEDAAKDSLFDDDLRATVLVGSAFEGSVRGLSVGAVVEYRGLKIGEVQDLAVLEPEEGQEEILLLVSYTMQPKRLGITGINNPDEVFDTLDEAVRDFGMRARLKPNSIFTGGLYVEIFEDPDAEPAVFDRDADPLPLLPTVATPPDTLRVAAGDVMERVSALPIEELMDRMIELITHVNTLVEDENTRQIPGEVSALLQNANAIAGAPETKDLTVKLNAAISSVADLLNEFEQRQGIDALIVSLENLRDVTANVSSASENAPGITQNIDELIKKIRDLPVDTTVESVNAVLASTDQFISSDDTQDLPQSLSGALEEVRLTLAELREGGAVTNLNQTLSSASNAADEIAAAAKLLPQLARDLETVADTAEATIGAYGPVSPFNTEVRAAVGDLRQAVRSLDALIKAVQRNPNSLVFGR